MSLRSRSMLAAVVGLWMAHPLPAQEPATNHADAPTARSASSTNQQTANTIAAQLRQSGQLRGYHIDVAFANGVVELSGSVADRVQREEALRVAQAVDGVSRVIDRLNGANGSAITLVQGQTKPSAEEGPAPRQTPPANAAPFAGEPVPIMQGAAPSPYDLNPPSMPPYAWPTYAPHNNYSRVAYPTAYPYNAWPFIGPMYPFPKVPLGWRSVKLEWQDGHWWFMKTATRHDWWQVKYW